MSTQFKCKYGSIVKNISISNYSVLFRCWLDLISTPKPGFEPSTLIECDKCLKCQVTIFTLDINRSLVNEVLNVALQRRKLAYVRRQQRPRLVETGLRYIR